MFTIHLDKLEFFAHHGLHAEETIIGNSFVVSAAVSFDIKEKVTSIHHTINYVNVYAIIKKHMQQPVPLLETLAQNITEEISVLDKSIHRINISITKLNPPLNNFTGSLGVSYSKDFNQ